MVLFLFIIGAAGGGVTGYGAFHLSIGWSVVAAFGVGTFLAGTVWLGGWRSGSNREH